MYINKRLAIGSFSAVFPGLSVCTFSCVRALTSIQEMRLELRRHSCFLFFVEGDPSSIIDMNLHILSLNVQIQLKISLHKTQTPTNSFLLQYIFVYCICSSKLLYSSFLVNMAASTLLCIMEYYIINYTLINV